MSERPIFDDLVFALAAVDWAEAQLPSFNERMQNWVDTNLDKRIEHLENNPTHDMLVAFQMEEFPLHFSVEFGAYINVIRSSLDILACAVAQRHGITKLDNVYFPIARDADRFSVGNYKGHEFIKAISVRNREIFESFKPYGGGNSALWQMHNLDVERKHRRLLSVEPKVANFWTVGWGEIIPISGDIGANGETALCFFAKGGIYPQMHLTGAIAVIEPHLGMREQAGHALKRFCAEARKIITAFKLP